MAVPPAAQTFLHPDAVHTVLPHLQKCLPEAINQEYLILHGLQVLITLASFPPGDRPPMSEPWAVGTLDLSRPMETEFWFWSSAETARVEDEDEPSQALRFEAAYPQLHAMFAFIHNEYPDKELLFVGSLHASFVPYLPKRVNYISGLYAMMVFTPDALPPMSDAMKKLAERYDFRTVEDADLDRVIATSFTPRKRSTLRTLSSTGVYVMSRNEQAHAWGFTSKDGTITSLYVTPEERGKGLAKLMMRQELEKNFQTRRFVAAHVKENEPSRHVCESLDATKICDTVWLRLYLDEFGATE